MREQLKHARKDITEGTCMAFLTHRQPLIKLAGDSELAVSEEYPIILTTNEGYMYRRLRRRQIGGGFRKGSRGKEVLHVGRIWQGTSVSRSFNPRFHSWGSRMGAVDCPDPSFQWVLVLGG